MEITCGLISSNSLMVKKLKDILCSFNKVECLWSSRTYDDALDQLLKYPPTIVFLDIDSEWERKTTFLLYHELNLYLEQPPSFIAVSENKNFSYEVIKSGMRDYILYPFSEFELRKCFMKFSKEQKRREVEKICIKSNTDYRYIEMEEVVYLKADNNTTDLFLLNGKKVSAYKTLKYFEKNLPSEFLRVHNSYVINTSYVTRINFGKSSLVLKGYDEFLPFSKSYRKAVENLKKRLQSSIRVVA